MSAAVAASLAEGCCSPRELASAAGLDPDDAGARSIIRTEVARLREAGVPIVNTRRAGSHAGARYLARRIRCQHPGCGTVLGRYSHELYCHLHARRHVDVDSLSELNRHRVCAVARSSVEGLIAALSMDAEGWDAGEQLELPSPASEPGARLGP